MNRILLFTVFICATSLLGADIVSGQQLRWYKGNTHTHTLNTDGDSPPDVVVKWYADHGYNFVVLTDHDSITPVDELNSVYGKASSFIVIRGEEVTDRFDKKPYHVNGLGVQSVVKPQNRPGIVENLQANVNAIRAAKGIPQINHPNFGWAISAEDLVRLALGMIRSNFAALHAILRRPT